ncbi:MAG: hypothetical protein Q4C68_03815 [Moraxella sp.]|nr:hypothetical protein [Moraxella sp.]
MGELYPKISVMSAPFSKKLATVGNIFVKIDKQWIKFDKSLALTRIFLGCKEILSAMQTHD